MHDSTRVASPPTIILDRAGQIDLLGRENMTAPAVAGLDKK